MAWGHLLRSLLSSTHVVKGSSDPLLLPLTSSLTIYLQAVLKILGVDLIPDTLQASHVRARLISRSLIHAASQVILRPLFLFLRTVLPLFPYIYFSPNMAKDVNQAMRLTCGCPSTQNKTRP